MANDLSAAVEDQLQANYGIIPLLKLEIPDFVVGYYHGPRPLDYNGFTYTPNTIEDIESIAETLDNVDEERRITLTGSTAESGLVSTAIQDTRYIGAPATIARLIVNVETGEIIGLGETSIYEIYDLSIDEEPTENKVLVRVLVDLRAVGYTGRRKTSSIRSTNIHQSHFSANSTFYEELDTAANVQKKWGQRSG